MAKPPKLEARVAFHEAGHAVIGFWAGVASRLLTVSIVPDGENGTLGHVRRGKLPRVRDVEPGADGRPRIFYRDFDPTVDSGPLTERRLKPMILECFAGVIAEKQFDGHRHNWAAASHDLRLAGRLIDYLTGSEKQAQKYSDFLWVVAEDSVKIHWSEIEDLAKELIVRKALTGRETKLFLQEWQPRLRDSDGHRP